MATLDRRLFLKAAGAGIATTGLFALAACAAPAPQGGGGGGATNGGVRLRAAWWGGDVRHAKFNEIYDLYQTKNSGVTIEREFADYASYWERLPTQFAGANAPDIFHVTERQIMDYATRNQVVDLNEFADSGALDLSYFSKAALDAGTVDGKLVMLMVGETIPATMYNQTVLESVGAQAPGTDWDWDQFRAVCEQLTSAGLVGSTYQAISSPTFNTFLAQEGKGIFKRGEAAIDFDAKDGETWFTFWKDLQDAGLCQSAESVAEEQGAPFEDTLFAKGEAGMHVQNSNQLVTFQTAVGDTFTLGLAPFPQMGQEPAALIVGSEVCINAGAEQPEEAAKVIDFFVNDPEANKIFKLELGTPGNSNWSDAIADDLAGPDKAVLDFAESVKDLSVYALPYPTGGSRVDPLMTEVGLAVAFGQVTPAEAGQRLVDELTAALNA
jgi:multiple sugar transport system substrate-binding protein